MPWSRKASSVAGGTVLTVSGPIKVSTYIVSGYAGFLVLVEAHSGRCTSGAFLLQFGKTVATEDALERFVGELGIGDRSLAQQRIDALLLLLVGGFLGELSKLLVHHVVNSADEEAGDRGYAVHR